MNHSQMAKALAIIPKQAVGFVIMGYFDEVVSFTLPEDVIAPKPCKRATVNNTRRRFGDDSVRWNLDVTKIE